MSFFEPVPKTPERMTNNASPPNIKEERDRKRKASLTVEDLHIETHTTLLAEKVADAVATKLTPLFDRLEQKIDHLGMQMNK